jgi:hypothetical protein
MRNFETGATRNSDDGKMQYARIFDPSIDKAYAEYMNSQRVQADGKVRDPDNWKKGIPVASYLDSQRRHWHDVWCLNTGRPDLAEEKDLVTALCALKFNVDGMLYEVLKARREDDAVTVIKDAKLVSWGPDSSSPFDNFTIPAAAAGLLPCFTCHKLNAQTGKKYCPDCEPWKICEIEHATIAEEDLCEATSIEFTAAKAKNREDIIAAYGLNPSLIGHGKTVEAADGAVTVQPYTSEMDEA